MRINLKPHERVKKIDKNPLEFKEENQHHQCAQCS